VTFESSIINYKGANRLVIILNRDVTCVIVYVIQSMLRFVNVDVS